MEKYLEKCLDSLVSQTLKDIQIIIVNDGSNDTSYKIIERYKAEYSKKIVCIEKENGGQADARNIGLRYAKGEYIGWVDGDDYVNKTMFEKMYLTAKLNDGDMVECNWNMVYGNKIKPKIRKKYELRDIFIGMRLAPCNKIIKRSILENSNISYPLGVRYEDVEYFVKIIPYITSIGFIEEPLYYYVQRQNSTNNAYDERTMDIFRVLDNVLKYYKEEKLYEKYEKQLEYIYARELLGSSFFRMIKIKEKKLKERVLQENWRQLLNTFPNWKNNILLKRNNSLLGLFIKSQNRLTYTIYSKILSILFS